MSVTWKRSVVLLSILLIVGVFGSWWINHLKNRWFTVEFETKQTEADFVTHQERIDFVSDLSGLEVPNTAYDLTFVKEGWQDHSIIGRFQLPVDQIDVLVNSIPKTLSHSAGIYQYTSDDGRIHGYLRINRATRWVEIESYYD